MKVTLEEYGGLAAGLSRRPRIVDADALPPAAAAELNRLVEAAKAASGGDALEGAPDEMGYDVTIEDATGKTLLTRSDTAMTPEFAALMRWIKRQATG